VGLASVSDPLATLRKPVAAARKDPAAAARLLGAGVSAYRAGRFADAEALLVQAAKSDDADPLVWYFLGAARWQLGSAEQARADFRQGAERERNRTVSGKAIEQAIAPIQGPARDALTAARP